ncbi:O-antigen ligase family protein [Catenovulum sp. 2E275]|uniref:O-antigen ligase family protein n=1 Tax=Catenovulum sp. 2E275 TaxID=2980497 RepID=UPI0021D02E6E|nr:O-antigen ligase family protein [Catenovulum sp. 2E275]MCU4677336.1 O-antigen ligase family protein [Catenovulum sp. 2E275]
MEVTFSIMMFEQHRIYFILCILGYPIAVVLAQLISIDNFFVSVVYRALLIVFSLYFIIIHIVSKFNKSHLLIIILFVFFWVSYFLRAYYQVETEGLNKPIKEYFIWGVGVCLLPALAVARLNPIITFKGNQTYLSIALCVSVILFLFSSDTVADVNGDIYSNGRIQLEAFNTLAFGNLAATLIIIAFTSGVKNKYILLGIYIFCFYLLITAASRGALVSLVCSFIFFITCSRGISKFKLIISFSFLAIISSNFITSSFTDRILDVLNGTDVSMAYRFISYLGAMEIFLENPILGASLEEPNTGYYPHNILLEVAMSLGIFGTSILILLVYLAFRGGTRYVKLGREYALIPMLFIQYFVAANFSGSIVTNNVFWYLLLMAISLNYLSIRKQ